MKFTGGYLIFSLLCSFLCCSNSAQGSPTAIAKAEDKSEEYAVSGLGINNSSSGTSLPANDKPITAAVPEPHTTENPQDVSSAGPPVPPTSPPTIAPNTTTTTTTTPTPPTTTSTTAPTTTPTTAPTTAPTTTPTTAPPTTSTVPPTTTAKTTPAPPPPTTAQPIPPPTPAPHHNRFDGPSFVGGIVLSLGLIAIGFIGWKYYKARSERNYRTL